MTATRPRRSLSDLDKRYVWHPFTQMQEWVQNEPLMIERAEGNYLIDPDGRRYLDAVSSLWVNVHGHNHPAINRAIVTQLERVAHTTLLGLSNVPSVELASRLIELTPDSLQRVFYSDSGSTAVEIALKQAFQYWQHRRMPEKHKFVHLADAYHGDTLGAVAVGGIGLFHEAFGPLLVSTYTVRSPRRCASSGADPCATALAELESLLAARAGEIAALIIEPLVQGAAGMLVQPPGYLSGVARLCREHQVLLIADEVATGFGRTGTMFACEQEQVEPDFMCVAKGITGGYLPLAATLATDEVYSSFLGASHEGKAFYHGHTYTGNPLACAAALASLDLFEENRVLEGVRSKAIHLAAAMDEHLTSLPWVAEIRQKGLMVGIELAEPETSEPFAPESRVGARVCHAARKHGVIVRPLGDVVVLMPPLSVTAEELNRLVQAIAASVDEICG